MTTGHGLDGKTLIVTGAAGALGSAIVRAFVSAGVRAVGLVDHDAAALRTTIANLHNEKGDVEFVAIPLDVTDHDAVHEAYRDFAVHVGGLDVAINNAGIVAPSARLHNVRPEDFRRVLDVNLAGIFNCLQASIIEMRGRGGGSIVNTASVAGFTTWTHNSPYGVSKAGVIQLTKIAAAEYAKESIRVNCVCPGTFITSFHDEMPDGAMDGVLAKHPLGRFGTTDEIAAAYVYLAGNNATWITGTSMVIDGGMSVG